MLSRDDLRAIALFESLGDEQLDTILERQRESVHQADQVIVMEQDWGESLFLLCDGLAKVRTYTSDGDEVVMSLLGSGDVFGELAVFDGDSRSADVVALTSLRLVKLRIPPLPHCLKRTSGLESHSPNWRRHGCVTSTGDSHCRLLMPRPGCWMHLPTWRARVLQRMTRRLRFLRSPNRKSP